jgi:Carbon-nitrogen hydrolase
VTKKTGQRAAESKRVRVAIAQSAPVYLDKRASLGKALDLVQQAAKRDAQLVAFGETWLPGYPAWLDVCPGAALWDNTFAKEVFAKLRNNSITIPGEEVNALSEAARDLKIAILMGASERVDAGPGNGTLYNSLLTISEGGQLRNHHRKLVPTYTERLVWGNGDGRGLEAVHVCWTHRRIDLLGALDAACTHGQAQFRRAHPCRSVANRPRITSVGQQTLFFRGPVFCDNRRPDDAGCGRTSGASTRCPTFVR